MRELITQTNRCRAQNALIVEAARDWIGVPFRAGQASRQGCNCMGLVIGVLREIGLNDLSALQAGTPRILPNGLLRGHLQAYCLEVACEDRMAGDFLLFTVGGVEQHVGIASEQGRMIHTHMSLERVAEQSMAGWEKRLTGVFRFRACIA